jgi:pimeloyl-ACP methyl ester carboxylesterase
MTHTEHPVTRTLAVPGARLYSEVRGSGPALAVVGSPMAAGDFAGFAHALADRHTVITYDPRGISGSPVDDPAQDSTPELRADDVAAVLDAVGADTADVFGSSGGAVTGLALATRHPDRIRTLVAHEPPLLELLPDAAEQRAKTDDIVDTFRRQGVGAAWMKFMTNAGFDVGGGGAPGPAGEPSAPQLSNSRRFFEHELRPTARYLPDIAALRGSPCRRRRRGRVGSADHLPDLAGACRAAGHHARRVSRRPRRLSHRTSCVRRPADRGPGGLAASVRAATGSSACCAAERTVARDRQPGRTVSRSAPRTAA